MEPQQVAEWHGDPRTVVVAMTEDNQSAHQQVDTDLITLEIDTIWKMKILKYDYHETRNKKELMKI